MCLEFGIFQRHFLSVRNGAVRSSLLGVKGLRDDFGNKVYDLVCG